MYCTVCTTYIINISYNFSGRVDSASVSVTGASSPPPPSRPGASPPRPVESVGVHGHRRLPVGSHVLVHGRLPTTGPDTVATTTAAVCVQHTTCCASAVIVHVCGNDRRRLQGPETLRRDPNVGERLRYGQRRVFASRIGDHRRRWSVPAEHVPDMRKDVRPSQHAQDPPAHALG